MQSAAISTRALDLLLLLRGSEPEGLGRADQVSYQIETAILMGILAEGDRLPTESVTCSGTWHLADNPSPVPRRPPDQGPDRNQPRPQRRKRHPPPDRTYRHAAAAQASGHEHGSPQGPRGPGPLSRRCPPGSPPAVRTPERSSIWMDLADRHADTADERARRRMDSRFHVAVSIASQSSRLTWAALQLEAELMTLWWGHAAQSSSESSLEEQHRAIVDAIRERDADAAARAAEHHSRSETEYLIEQHLRLTMQPQGGR